MTTGAITFESELGRPLLRRFLMYFLRLGTVGFGGPIALAGDMHRDLVEDRKWISNQDFLEGLSFSQLSPGPLAAQLAMYLGWLRGGTLGATLEDDCDSSTYDPTTKYLYVVNGGKGAHQTYSLISIIDTTSAKKIADIKIDTDSVEAMALESAGPRLFANLTGLNSVGVFDRGKRTQLAKWSIADEAQKNGPLAFDEANHRLFVVTGKPGKLILDSDSGRIVGSFPCVSLADEVAYDPGKRRIYIAGDEFIDVFQQQDADHYTLLGKMPGSFRAKIAILLPDMNRYYLAVPRRGTQEAEVRVYSVSQ